MGAIAFTRNYTDHSNDTGYQFEFHCDKCGNGYRSSFQASTLGVGSKIAKGLGSLFGGSQLWAAGQAGEYMKDGLRGGAWDKAFQTAVEEIKPKFHQCAPVRPLGLPRGLLERSARTMCNECAPDLAQEAASAQAHIAADQLADEDARRRSNRRQSIRARRCSRACPSCHSQLQAGAKFCAGCGKPVGRPGREGILYRLRQPARRPARKFCSGCGQAAG